MQPLSTRQQTRDSNPVFKQGKDTLIYEIKVFSIPVFFLFILIYHCNNYGSFFFYAGVGIRLCYCIPNDHVAGSSFIFNKERCFYITSCINHYILLWPIKLTRFEVFRRVMQFELARIG